VPIDEYPVSGGIEVGIQHSISFALWEAAIAAGATLDELYRLENGAYSGTFMAKLLVWHKYSRLISNHIEDAKAKAIKTK